MLNLALVFLAIAIIAALFGFTGIAGDLAAIAWLLVLVFAALFVVSLVLNILRGRGPSAS
jgi:uncharacterized membrane protein YtjA (UPF0391 family)